jgi:hypothetical protein
MKYAPKLGKVRNFLSSFSLNCMRILLPSPSSCGNYDAGKAGVARDVNAAAQHRAQALQGEMA